MAQYIDKDALVAEIKNRRDSFYSLSESCEKGTPAKAGFYAQAQTLEGILSFLDTLEVKEVDLEKELNDFIKQQKAWIKDNSVAEYDNGDSFNHIYDIEEIAKHFFELGLKTQKEE